MRKPQRKFVRGRPRPSMRRGTALEIAGRFFRSGDPMPHSTRDDILATQMPTPQPPAFDPTFAGWTVDERVAFYTTGMIPQRFKT